MTSPGRDTASRPDAADGPGAARREGGPMSGKKETRPYGLWPSPLTPESMAQGRRLSDVAWDTDGETLLWLEGRSDRGVLVCATVGPANGDAPRDLTSDLSVRALVGYGGGGYPAAGAPRPFGGRSARRRHS